MTLEEAEALAKVFEKVDGGCCVCVRSTCVAANKKNLGWFWAPLEDGARGAVAVYIKKEDMPEWFRSLCNDEED
jgi:hypothetical protein